MHAHIHTVIWRLCSAYASTVKPHTLTHTDTIGSHTEQATAHKTYQGVQTLTLKNFAINSRTHRHTHQIPPHFLTYWNLLAISVDNGGLQVPKLMSPCSLSWRLIGSTDNPITTFLPVLLTSSVIFSASLLWSSLNSRIKLIAVPSTSTVFYAPLTSHPFLLTCTLWPVFLCLPFYAPSTGPFVFCHGVHKRRRSHVSDTAGRQVQRTSRCVSTHTHTHTENQSPVKAGVSHFSNTCLNRGE